MVPPRAPARAHLRMVTPESAPVSVRAHHLRYASTSCELAGGGGDAVALGGASQWEVLDVDGRAPLWCA
jgi:hypothetical protein